MIPSQAQDMKICPEKTTKYTNRNWKMTTWYSLPPMAEDKIKRTESNKNRLIILAFHFLSI